MSNDPDLDSAYALKTLDDTRKLYADWAETYDADFVEAATYRHPGVVAETYIAKGGTWPCLDVGCGTGALAALLPRDATIDGIDLSPQMLAVARRKGLYRDLFEADVTRALALPDAAYAGLVSSGTFTHGHVGAEALDELVRVLAPGALAVISVKCEVWDGRGFATTFDRLGAAGLVTPPERTVERVYADPEKAPPGHAGDLGYIASFRRL